MGRSQSYPGGGSRLMPAVVTLKGGALSSSSGFNSAMRLLLPPNVSASLAHTFFHSCAGDSNDTDA